MSGRYFIIAAIVVLYVGVLLYAVDYQSLMPTTLQGFEGTKPFIERWFGFSPDGGDGSISIMFLLILLWILTAIVWRLLSAKPKMKR
jgi:hypothetical protein